ncbi:RHS repeat-associated core domain-containing protein [Leptospira weilii]|uniref:RHS repeat-associated core domain-containing protein n=1 Tax=Leptospira weilii TaxID=28184 RepID=UPI001E37B208|nr:RHS repeat-associated core domain-containing protein [Leptospira weilii]
MNRILLLTILLHVALQIEAKSPVSEKQKRINHVEYNRTLKYKRSFLRKPPYPLIPKPYPLEYVKGRMVRLNSSGDVDGSNKVLQDAVYSFNPNNNITGIANNSTDWSAQYDYGYDGLGRLTNATGSYLGIAEGNLSREFQQSYSYAKNGNLTAKRIHDPASGAISDEWSYQYTNHQVTNIDSSKSGNDAFVMQYDASGNLIRQRDNAKDLTKRIQVDSQDRITQIQDGNNAILGSYWYDEGGFRIRKSSLEPKNNQFANVEILYPSKFYGLEFIEAENVITSVNNVYLNGVRIAALNEVGALAYFLTDQVDSVSLVLDDEGKTLSKMQYLPYGETFVQRGDTNFAPKYNSQELDRESGFYFYNARFYDPGIARFTSADAIIDGEWDTQGWNRFSYVKGNPIGAKDPTGHISDALLKHQVQTELMTGGGGGPIRSGMGNSSLSGRGGQGSSKGSTSITNSSQARKNNISASKTENVKEIKISKSKYPESAKHVEDAQKSGKPSTLTIDRGGAKDRRRESLKGVERQPGKDRDEYPPALFKEGGKGSSVRNIPSSDNRGSGACLGNACKGLPNGSKVKITIGD